MLYPEEFVQPMRQEVTRLGVRELRTAEEVDAALGKAGGTTLVFVNSICGCAAGKARPGLALALKHKVIPDLLTTVFAGQDAEATAHARSYFAEFPSSSPSFALLRDGKVVQMIHRFQIENQMAETVAAMLIEAFETHCLARAHATTSE